MKALSMLPEASDPFNMIIISLFASGVHKSEWCIFGTIKNTPMVHSKKSVPFYWQGWGWPGGEGKSANNNLRHFFLFSKPQENFSRQYLPAYSKSCLILKVNCESTAAVAMPTK